MDADKPILLSYRESESVDGGFAEQVLDLAESGVKGVAENLNRQLRYGEVTTAPVAVNYLEGYLGNVGDVRTIVVIGVFPVEVAEKIGELIKEAVDLVFQRKP